MRVCALKIGRSSLSNSSDLSDKGLPTGEALGDVDLLFECTTKADWALDLRPTELSFFGLVGSEITGLFFGGEEDNLLVRNLRGGGLAGTNFIGLSAGGTPFVVFLAIVLFSQEGFTVHSPFVMFFLMGENLLGSLESSSVLWDRIRRGSSGLIVAIV